MGSGTGKYLASRCVTLTLLVGWDRVGFVDYSRTGREREREA